VTTDIEVLKEKVTTIQGAVTEVGTKMDVLLDLQIQLVTLQVQHDNTRDSLDRAFKHIHTVREEATETEGRLSRFISFVRGGAIVGAFLLGFAQWYILQQLAMLQDIADHAENFNLRLTLIERKIWPDKQ
jgi:hypothetical protein